MSGTFTCASCGGTWEKGRSDEEAEAERRELTADLEDETAVTCDDCFRKIMGRVQLEAPELLAPGAPLVEGACYRTPGGLAVHYAGCWCNYGEPDAPELRDDMALTWPQRQDLARRRLERSRHCQAAVDAENAAGDALRREDGLPPREHSRTESVAEASAEIGVKLNALQREHGLTNVEMLQAVGAWQMSCLKHTLRAERHPDNPGDPADWE